MSLLGYCSSTSPFLVSWTSRTPSSFSIAGISIYGGLSLCPCAASVGPITSVTLLFASHCAKGWNTNLVCPDADAHEWTFEIFHLSWLVV